MPNNSIIQYVTLILFLITTATSCNDTINEYTTLTDSNKQTIKRLASTPYYYWHNGKKVNISPVNNLYYISSDDSLSLEKIQLKSKSISLNCIKKGRFIEEDKRYWKIVEVNDCNITESPISIASELQNKNIYLAPVFRGKENRYIATSEYFYVKLKSENDYQSLKNIAKEQSAEIIKEIEYMPNWFLIKSPITSNGLTMSNLFYESGKFEDIDPAFMFNFGPTACSPEPDYNKQWGLDKMNLCNTWNISKGNSDILVAVLDQGVDQNHIEFANNYSSLSYDLINRETPSIVRGDHGTHVGGIIGANHNNIQIAGVAPQAKILSISHDLEISPTISSQLATGISYAKLCGAAVINNSWGDQGGFFEELHSSILEASINSALKSGRNGKGMVVVFAAGNHNIPTVDYPASTFPDILVVGAIDSSNKRSNFSSYGTHVDVVAPGSDIWSTLPNNKTDYMSGTSMAAPHVAGVAALLISANPNLTGKEVVNIIERTAQKIGDYHYTKVSNRPNGTWNNEMGYGLCNAFKAVSTAKDSFMQFNDKTVSSTQSVTAYNIVSENVMVTNGAKLTFNAKESVTIKQPFTIHKGSQIEIYTN